MEVFESCVLLIQRFIPDANIPKNFRKVVKIYDIANICDDKSFRVRISETETRRTSTAKLPVTMIIPPQTLHFVAALKPLDVSHKPQLDLIINVVASPFNKILMERLIIILSVQVGYNLF